MRVNNFIFFIEEHEVQRMQNVHHIRIYTVPDGGVILSAEM